MLSVGDHIVAVNHPFYVIDKQKGQYMVIEPGIPCKILGIHLNVWRLETPLGIGDVVRYMDWKKV